MKTTKLFLILFMLISICNIFAAFYTITFRETAATGVPTSTRNLILAENPSYPLSPLPVAADRWLIQVYKSTDNVINPLNVNGLPTGDDIATVTNIASTQGLVFATTNVWLMNSIRFYNDGLTGNTYCGDNVYLRIFNASTIASATKYIQSTSLFTVPSANTTVNYIPTYGWSPSWIPIAQSNPPDPAVLVLPADVATNLAFSTQNLSWTAAGTGAAPTGYKIFFGTDNPPTNIADGVTQPGTTFTTGLLLQNHTYFWKIVPYNTIGDAVGCPIWSFTTRPEINPEPATNPLPANSAIVEVISFPYNQTLSWSAPSSGHAPTGYKLFWNLSSTPEDLGNVLTASKPVPSAGSYSWQVVPYYTDLGTSLGTRSVRMGKPVVTRVANATNARGDATGCPTWSFTASLAVTHAVDITSNPSDADIYIGGVDSGFNTPHQFLMIQGTGATYSVQKAGYDFTPADFVVTNIQANTSQAFTGTIRTYTVDVQSAPTGADIFVNSVDSGFNTPHQFVLTYGSSATYSVQMDGYSWTQPYAVTNIQANVAMEFLGTVLTYSVNIASTPSDADIFVGGVDTGFNTPHIFTLNYGTGATYTVQKAGYTFAPTDFVVSNIQANASQDFTGTILTYTVDVSSTPSDADIFVGGVDSGFNTPHQFVMDYGTNAVYTVHKTGYSFAPADLVVNNIQANVVQAFTGSVLTYTVDIISSPTDADIYVGGTDSGFNTPHQFVMNYGTDATYTVQKAGYTWAPSNLVVTNIQASTSQNFTGTVITYNVDITSAPADADIFVDGVDSGFNTPHQFVLNYGTNATYTVQKYGYTWAPTSFIVTNIQANAAYNFVGTQSLSFVDITSTPTDADIFANGVDTGFNTPHQFALALGSNATYTVQKAGYTWAPANLTITNIQANTSQNFTGTLLTYTVDITSTPVDADIFVGGIDSGFNTPHQFVMNYGTSATYTIMKTGYSFAPNNLVVTNIQANTNQAFTGTLLTYTVDITSTPVDADIFVDGVDSGFNSPHQFVLNYGSSATYSVSKVGYTWLPASYAVSNITANQVQNFTGTIITFTVDITSAPVDADIFIDGVDSGFNTPHQFFMNYGTNAVYTVQKAGYSFTPANFAVTNIVANTNRNFTGTILTYTVDITSNPSNADIYANGIDTGFNTPHQYILTYGTNVTYTVSKAGYSWTPADFVVNAIQANTVQNFVGTLLTYTVDITSIPTDADIYVGGIDSGFNTPHQFVMNYGSSSTYSVQKAGYTWSPNFVVTNIQANTSNSFVGTLLTFNVNLTSTPTGADIFVDGIDSGFNTPYQFVLNYGANATYTIQKTGYAFSPASYVVTNLQANASQNFTGTLLTYTVALTSVPTGADIYIGNTDTGFNTPYTFVLSYGTSTTYTIKKAGYTWSPATYAVNNIQANANQNFVGTIITYTVDITSTPTNSDIFVGGIDTGFNSPHTFVMNYGTSATYTVQKAGYSWTPANFVVNSIQANTSQAFIGTVLSYNVILTSTPTNADIFVGGIDTGFNTPHQFVLNYGSNATYSIQKTGYSFSPVNYVVTNIQANASQNFVGTLLSYTVDINSNPVNADIYVGGIDTGFNTPHQFSMSYGANAIYTVAKAGYTWAPASYSVSNIHANSSQSFTGTLISYSVNISSIPADADILIGGVDTGFNTPHVFLMNYGTSATYSVIKAGYIWSPSNFVVSNIQSSASQTFAGILTALAVTPSTQNVSYQAGTTSFTVNSNVAWTVSEDVSWLSVTSTSGTNDGRLIVSYDTNSSSISRVGQILISGSGLSRIVTIHQTGSLATISVTPNNQMVTSLAGTTTLAITSNTQWSVSENVSWLSVSPASGNNNGVVTVTFDANTSPATRTGQIYITGNRKTISVSITQEAAPVFLGVIPQNSNVSSNAGTISLNVNSNIDWRIAETVSWLSVSPSHGTNNGTVQVTYNANPTSTARNGQISFISGNVVTVAVVTQAGAPAGLTVTPPIQYVSNIEGTTTFTITSNIDWTISEDVSWLTVSPANGSNNGMFIVTHEANPTNSVRTGQITITWGESLTTVNVIQFAGSIAMGEKITTPAINVFPNPFVASTNIKVDVAADKAEIAVYSIKGQLIKTIGMLNKGTHTLEWNGKDESGRQCSNGFYLIRYKGTDMTKTIKVLMIKK